MKRLFAFMTLRIVLAATLATALATTLSLTTVPARAALPEPEDFTPLEPGAGADALFPFEIVKSAPDNITNVQTWGTPAPDTASGGMVHVRDGLFVNDRGPCYFFGSNQCFSCSFPDKATAKAHAAALARFGINVIRLHHMDSREIWKDGGKKSVRTMDPDKLDRLDYLVYQFHKHGIYVNINLHVSRMLDQRDGFEPYNENSPEPPHNTRMNKGVDNYVPRMIELQKEYARALLTHVNPYTGLAYIDDPGVAMIEINNENSMVSSWNGGTFDKLEGPYSILLRDKWNAWLAKKYPNQAALDKAWHCHIIPFGKEKVVPFDQEGKGKLQKPWWVQTDKESKVSVSTVAADSVPGVSRALRLDVAHLGKVPYIPQILCPIEIEANTTYTFSFRARGRNGQTISTGVSQDHDPWRTVGMRSSVKLSDAWQQYTFVFKTTDGDKKSRISFSSFEPGVPFELADVSLRSGGDFSIPKGTSLAQGNIAFPLRHKDTFYGSNASAMNDWSMFLAETENEYWQEMYHFVKDELKAKQPVAGTQLNYGFGAAQARLDYCDIHAYWHHPSFPRKRWDSNDWYIGGSALAQQIATGGATLPRLAVNRVIGKPFTVSEYDHPYPNLYCAEGNPMFAAVGAFQNWSGLFQFAWSHTSDLANAKTAGFFDMYSNTVKLAHLPACYAMFLRGDVRRGPGRFVYENTFTPEQETAMFADNWLGKGKYEALHIDPVMSLAVFSGMNIPGVVPDPKQLRGKRIVKTQAELPNECGNAEKKRIVNDFAELYWSFESDKTAYFKVDTVGTKVFSGFIDRKNALSYRGMTMTFGKTMLDWATVSVVRKQTPTQDAKMTRGNYLVTATGFMQNTGAKMVVNARGDITSASKLGGSRGSGPVLCEGIPFELTLRHVAPESVKAWALDNTGKRTTTLKVTASHSDSDAVVTFGPQYKTLWYELEIE